MKAPMHTAVLSLIAEYRLKRDLYTTSTAETNRQMSAEITAGTYLVEKPKNVLLGLAKQIEREKIKNEAIAQFNHRYR